MAVTEGPILVEALAYGEATDYLTVDAGTYPLEIRAAGDEAAALSLDATLEVGQNYTAIAMDDPESEAGVQVIVATEAMTMSPNTAMAPLAAPLALVGVALIGLAFVTAAPLALRRARS